MWFYSTTAIKYLGVAGKKIRVGNEARGCLWLQIDMSQYNSIQCAALALISCENSENTADKIMNYGGGRIDFNSNQGFYSVNGRKGIRYE